MLTNPVINSVEIEYQLAESSDMRIAVLDIEGRNLMQILNSIELAGLNDHIFDVHLLVPGFYIIKLQSGSETFSARFIKQ